MQNSKNLPSFTAIPAYTDRSLGLQILITMVKQSQSTHVAQLCGIGTKEKNIIPIYSSKNTVGLYSRFTNPYVSITAPIIRNSQFSVLQNVSTSLGSMNLAIILSSIPFAQSGIGVFWMDDHD